MGLGFYDVDLQPVSDPLRTFHDGLKGGAYEMLLYVRNDDPGIYHTSIELSWVAAGGIDTGPLGTTGWSVKAIAGQRQPTQAEWDKAVAGANLSLGSIGGPGSPDLSTYLPFWIRVYAPGNTPAQLRVGQSLEVAYLEDPV